MSRWLLVALFTTASACSREPRAEDCPPDTGARVVDATLLAFLSRARAAHHAADRAEQAGDAARARRLLTELTAGPFPGGKQLAVEVREVLADTRARLADLASRAGDFAGADAELRAGLEQVPETSYFRGHLFEVSGLVDERRARDLLARGDSEGAKAANQRALEALEQAMTIQAEVIRKTTEPKPN
jgi:hypothetical protein